MSFLSDIALKDTSVYPVVIFETSPTMVDDLMISTRSVTIESRYFKPLLLEVPKIKESFDILTRKYKISDVRLDISNAVYGGKRFSDSLSNHDNGGYLNTECEIYLISPSVENSEINWGQAETNEAYLIYKGIVRNMEYDNKSCKVSLEDASQAILHKDVPVAHLPTDKTVADKYKGKPVPFVYGIVDKSPVVMKGYEQEEMSEGEFYVLADRTVAVGDAPAINIGSIEDCNRNLTTIADGFSSQVQLDGEIDPCYLMTDDGIGTPGLLVSNVVNNFPVAGTDPLWDDSLKEQFYVTSSSTIIGKKTKQLTIVENVERYVSNPLMENTAQAVCSHFIESEMSSSNIVSHSEEITWDVKHGVVQQPPFFGTWWGSAFQWDGVSSEPSTYNIHNLDAGVDFEFQSIPGISFTDNDLNISFYNSDSDDASDYKLSEVIIHIPAPPNHDTERFAEQRSRFFFGGSFDYDQISVQNPQLGHSFFIARTGSSPTDYNATYLAYAHLQGIFNDRDLTQINYAHPYDGYLEENAGSNELHLKWTPGAGHSVTIIRQAMNMKCERIYHVDKFNKVDLYAYVKGRSE